jgi:hypothetical protein
MYGYTMAVDDGVVYMVLASLFLLPAYEALPLLMLQNNFSLDFT